MKHIGAHVSISGGVDQAPQRAADIGGRAFAIFVGMSSRWQSKPISDEIAERFKEECRRLGFSPRQILPHVNYLVNLGSPEPELLEKSRASFLDEMRRCMQLGLELLNFHPGSHKGLCEEDDCLQRIAESVNEALSQTQGVTAVLETTAGQGSNLGHRFEHLARIIELVDDKSRIGVCLDTCHSYSAGYDLGSEEGYGRTWQEFDSVIGGSYLRGIHLNDDKRECGSRIDRHASLGQGTLGEEFFRRFMHDPRFDDIPVILETPDDSLWAQEIAWLHSL